MWGSGFLPTSHNGVALRGAGDPVLYLPNPDGVTTDDRRVMLDALGSLNRRQLGRYGDPETRTRIAQYEMAFRMQRSVPDLVDVASEPKHILDLYGPSVTTPGTFANNALLPLAHAARLVEASVSASMQILHRGPAGTSTPTSPWRLTNQCDDTDQATHAAHHVISSPRLGSNAACSTTPWSSGAASSAARPTRRAS